MKHIILLSILALFLTAVNDSYGTTEKKMKEHKSENKHKYTNRLAGESSPYLLMHAHNPVDWYPWGREALDKAKRENKPIIISIGYAACHWCHVMEEESFQDPEVAGVMNENFVSIKVDREERPDIDQVYMNAAQLLTGRGGWPLNAVALPDGRPFYAGTYFPRENWKSLLLQISRVYRETPGKLEEQAKAVTEGIRSSEIVSLNTGKPGFRREDLLGVFAPWKEHLDFQWGGIKGAPKFPLPVGQQFLLRYYHLTGDKSALDAVRVTLEKMALGGIYDQVGGGFARYSTDQYWKVPHFEKMLYDNAQLVSLYAAAYQLTGDPLYKKVVYETLEFVERELTARLPGGRIGFYSSLDADSEGEEGKFYTWTKGEMDKILGEDAPLVTAYYGVIEAGNWEGGRNILSRDKGDEAFAEERKTTPQQLQERVTKARAKLLEARSKRPRPPLDHKILTSWNALMLKGYVDAYRAFGEESFLQGARKNARFLARHLMSSDGRLERSFREGRKESSINGFLDDYAFTVRSFISLYRATFEEKWLFLAHNILKYALAHFYDRERGMFYYTSDLDAPLIARKMEIADNVLPASNSMMAMNLYLLGEYFYRRDYTRMAGQMLHNVKANLVQGGTYYAQWDILTAFFVDPPFEVAIVGGDCLAKRKELDRHYLPHVILMGGKTEGRLPLLKDKLIKGQTTIFVCRDKACLFPAAETAEVLKQINPTRR